MDLTEDDGMDERVEDKGEEEELFSDLKVCIGGLMDAKAKAEAPPAPKAAKKRKKDGEDEALPKAARTIQPGGKKADTGPSGAEMASTSWAPSSTCCTSRPSLSQTWPRPQAGA